MHNVVLKHFPSALYKCQIKASPSIIALFSVSHPFDFNLTEMYVTQETSE